MFDLVLCLCLAEFRLSVSNGVHSVLEKSLKMLEFGIKTSRPLKVLKTDKVLEST